MTGTDLGFNLILHPCIIGLAGSPGAMSTHEKGLLLATLLARLNTNDVDKLLLRKLERLSKETPLSDGPEAEEVWEDGGRFGELINALLTFFEDYDEVNMRYISLVNGT